MNQLFEKKFTNDTEINEYIFDAINEYTKNTGNSMDSLIVIEYITLLKKYIEQTSKKATFKELISLIKGSIDVNQSGIVETDLKFTDLMTNDPENFLSTHYLLIKNRLDNEIIYDILLFLKYNLLSYVRENNCESKYIKEIKLIDEGIEEIEQVIEDEEDEDDNEDEKMPAELNEKIEKFLVEYKPYKIKEYLDKYIIGQDEAKRIVSTSIYNHMITIAHPELNLKKNNILMVGPSGCGKTEIMRVLSKILPVPLSIFDTSGMSQNGWKGDKKVKDAVKELVLKTEDIAAAEHGIIFLDEFDKMCRPAFTSSGENVSVHIQGEILAMIEGTTVEVSLAGEDVIGLTELIDTKNILFVCAGAFDGIQDIVKKEKNKGASIGIGSQLRETNVEMKASDITKETIIKFGVTPELAGRLTITTVLNKLTKDDMYDILTKCENNVIDELKAIVKTGYGVDVEINEDAIKTLIDKLCMDVGARGLRSIVFEYFNNILFDISSESNVKKVTVGGDLKPKLDYANKNKTKRTLSK